MGRREVDEMLADLGYIVANYGDDAIRSTRAFVETLREGGLDKLADTVNLTVEGFKPGYSTAITRHLFQATVQVYLKGVFEALRDVPYRDDPEPRHEGVAQMAGVPYFFGGVAGDESETVHIRRNANVAVSLCGRVLDWSIPSRTAWTLELEQHWCKRCMEVLREV